jgi:hypothetical protein
MATNARRQPNDLFTQARERLHSPSGTILSRRELADLINVHLARHHPAEPWIDRNYIGKIETGRLRWPHANRRSAFRAILDARTDAALGFMTTRGDIESATATMPGTDPAVPAAADGVTAGALTVMRSVPFDLYRQADLAARLLTGGMGGSADMDRRNFVFGLGGAVTLGMIAPSLGMETTRHGLMLASAQERATADVDEWCEIVDEYGYDYLRLPADELIQPLMIDLLGLQIATTNASGEPVRQELRKAGAVLAAFTAMTVANLGHVREARRWWRSARRIADESHDPDTILWVCGREVIRSLYEMRPVRMILDLAERAETNAGTGRTSALAELISGKAQALALAGRREEALATLDRVRAVYDRLPPEVTIDRESLFDWPENRLRFTESYVYSHLGDLTHADAAQNRAVQIYPPQYLRGPAQIELQRALCHVKDGDIPGGVRHAHQIIEQLPPKDRIRPVVDLGHTVLRSVAHDDRHLTAVTDFREYLVSIDAS